MTSRREEELAMVVTTLDVSGLTPEEYRAVLDEMGVERNPAPGLFLHMTAPIDDGFRITEIWDSKEGFEEFLVNRLVPANDQLNLDRHTEITSRPLHNFFAPRLDELSQLARHLPGAPRR
jgi:hypothetical protein